MFRGRFRVFQIVSYFVKRCSDVPQIHSEYCIGHLEVEVEVESINGFFDQVVWNSVKNSVFSRLCHISLITFPKILKLIESYIWTISNSLDSVLRLENIPDNAPRHILCFPDCVIST